MSCSNNLVEVEKSFEPLVPLDSIHPALNIPFSVGFTFPSCDTTQSFYNFKRTNFDCIRSFINSFNWHSTLISYKAESAMNIPYDALHQIILDYVPVCRFKKPSYSVWFSAELTEILLQKKIAHFWY